MNLYLLLSGRRTYSRYWKAAESFCICGEANPFWDCVGCKLTFERRVLNIQSHGFFLPTISIFSTIFSILLSHFLTYPLHRFIICSSSMSSRY